MVIKECLTKSKAHWELHEWVDVCPKFTYSVSGLVPNFIPLKLNDKFLDGYYASSGTTVTCDHYVFDMYLGFYVGLRKDGTELDEQPYVSIYDASTGRLLKDGFLQHGNYRGRTVKYDPTSVQSRLPHKKSGTLIDLQREKLITGIEVAAMRIMEEIVSIK